MYSVKFFMCLTTALFASACAENKQTTDASEDAEEKIRRRPRVSSEFGYNILNSDRVSNHYRQEHRDVNGVVRGSYGFKNPNGIFRLVQYVADDKGFRAHISSNENGVGKQNPASVSINRFEHKSSVTESKPKPPISPLRKQSSLYEDGGLKPEDNLSRYDFYSPIQASRTDGDSNFEFPFLDGNNAYHYAIERQELHSTRRQNPVDKLIGTRFNRPIEITPSFLQNERYDVRRPPIRESSPFSTVPFEHILAQNYNVNTYPDSDSLYVPPVLLNNNYHNTATSAQENSYKKSFSNYPPYPANLLHKPHHKVHNSLPDCNSVSSAVLCKPPTFPDDIAEGSRAENDGQYIFDEIMRTPASDSFLPNQESRVQYSPPSELGYKILDQAKRIYPLHLLPNSYPLRSEIYKNFLNYLHEHEKRERKDKDCHKNLYPDGTTSKDYFTPPDSYEYFNDASTITNDLSSYNFNRKDESPSQNVELTTSNKFSKNNEEGLYSSLIRIIENDESLMKLKNLLLQSENDQSSLSDKPSIPKEQSPKLSLLGVLILPSDVIKELGKSKKLITKNTLENFDESNVPLIRDVFESGTLDETQYAKESNKSLPEVNNEEDTDLNANVTATGNHNEGDETSGSGWNLPFHVPLIRRNPSQIPHYNSSDPQVETVTSAKFHVYDDQRNSNEENGSDSKSDLDNWRKVLEDEISKEIREASLNQDSQSLDPLLDSLTNPDNTEHSHEKPYSLNKHIGPLYDSTGKLIQPENVPIHIHRFNPPSGLTSLPWKFSIPRPAPPRSIVVPPKPPTIS